MQSHHEREFVLVDVRQPEEYIEGHIPGARLIPLNELESCAEELALLAERCVIFYCRGGARSARASAWARLVLKLPTVCNLLGGFKGWAGYALVDFPRLAAFDLKGTGEVLLRQALELEKGTHRLYAQIAAEYSSGVVFDTVFQLVDAELAHGQAVHQLLTELAPQNQQSFELAFAALPGSVIENGMSFDSVVNRARDLGPRGEMALLELALEIELGAYDLYKKLATLAISDTAQHALNELAQQEKGHAGWVLQAIGKIAEGMGRVAS